MSEEKNYLDETILEMKNLKNKEESNNIKDGVYIKNEYMEFEEIELFEKKYKNTISKKFYRFTRKYEKDKISIRTK